MRCSYAWDGRTVVKTFTGFVDGAGFIGTAEAVSADPRFDQLLVIYNDFLGIAGHSIDARAYARVAACRLGAQRTNPNFRVVFIASEAWAAPLRAAVRPHARGATFDPFVCTSMAAAVAWFADQPPLDALRGHLSAWTGPAGASHRP